MPSGKESVLPHVFATGKGEVWLKVISGVGKKPVGGIQDAPVTNNSIVCAAITVTTALLSISHAEVLDLRHMGLGERQTPPPTITVGSPRRCL